MEAQVGDLVFAHTDGVIGKAIRFGERLRWRKGSYWNHVAIVSRIEDGIAYVIQAEPSGVTDDKSLSSLGEYFLVECPVTKTAQVIDFARAQVGSHYGFWSILSCVFDIVTWDWVPSIRRDDTWICSALVAEALRYGGWLHDWGDIYTVTPAQLFQALVMDFGPMC